MTSQTTQASAGAKQPKRTPARASRHVPVDTIKAALAAAYTINPDEPYSQAALEAVAGIVGKPINRGTVHRWIEEYGPVVKAALPDNTATIVAQVQEGILQQWHEIRIASLERAKETVKQAGYRDVMVGAGISDDHILKRQSVPIEVEQFWRRWQADCFTLHRDPIEALQAMGERLHAKATLPAPTDETDGRLLSPGE